ncbi:hypothetical protein Tco_1417507 [Tanacetum coccineum]
MDDEPMWAADLVVAPNPSSAITIPKTANEFSIKGNHLTLIKGNQFDGRTKTNPHKHVHEFLRICDMFKYRDTKNDDVRLMMFPLSLTGEAKTCGRNDYNRDNYRSNSDDKPYAVQRQLNNFVKSQQSTNAFVKGTFMDFKSQLKTIAKNHQASIQNLEAKFDRLTEKQSARPSGSLPTESLKMRHKCRNTRSGKTYDSHDNPNKQQNKSEMQKDDETPINFDSEDEEEEFAPQPKPKIPESIKETPIPKPYKQRIPYP